MKSKGEVKIECFQEALDEPLDVLSRLEKAVFDMPIDKSLLKNELSMKSGLLILLARVDGRYVAYKVGYRLSEADEFFYSWIGGVHPEFRQQGLAKALMLEQHKLAKELGCTYVRTKTKNKYREMLILNIKMGFDIVGIHHKLNEKFHGIVLEKPL